MIRKNRIRLVIFAVMVFAENKTDPYPGCLLIAEPFLDDGYFRRSVVLLVEHNKLGSLGFILNKPLEIELAEAVPDFPEFDGKVFMGGPVQRDQLFYIHSLGDMIPESIQIADRLWWNGDFDEVKKLVATGIANPGNIRFFIGYSGWTEDQLSQEMKDKAWFVSKLSHKLIYAQQADDVWGDTLRSMGKDFGVMANFPVDPSLN